jgi:NADH-quinone oxidoreductase subunit A
MPRPYVSSRGPTRQTFAGAGQIPRAARIVCARRYAALVGYFGSYVVVLVLVAVGGGIVAGALTANRLFRPARPTPDKLATYESGVDPVGEGWAQSYVRYYVFTYLYVTFAVDAVFLFPCATVFAAPGYGVRTLAEMFVFLGVLAAGLVYARQKGVLSWV